MKKIIIIGNSGAGKSTLAKQLVDELSLAHLDLDTLAWQDSNPPKRQLIEDSNKEITEFLNNNPGWVIEGCYADLIELVLDQANEMIFLNPGTEQCIENCKNRPWEPLKYASKQQQDENLAMLIEWVKDYDARNDEFSLKSHRRLFDRFDGIKTERTANN